MDIAERILQRPRNKYLHSKEHVLADDLSRIMGEPKRFASYLGLAVLYHESDLRALARRVLAKEDLPLAARGKYFFSAVGGLDKRPGARLKRRRKAKRRLHRNGEERTTHRRASGRSAKKKSGKRAVR